MRRRYAIPTLTLMAVLPLAACSESSATTQERIVYLRQVARQGAETGSLLRDQEAPRIDKARCTRAFEGVTRREDYPSDMSGGGVSKEWEAQIREFFVDSCVSGKPKETPDDLDTTTTTTTTGTTGTTTTTTTRPEPTTTTTTGVATPEGTTTTTTTTTP